MVPAHIVTMEMVRRMTRTPEEFAVGVDPYASWFVLTRRNEGAPWRTFIGPFSTKEAAVASIEKLND
jgi:hypothetical protein